MMKIVYFIKKTILPLPLFVYLVNVEQILDIFSVFLSYLTLINKCKSDTDWLSLLECRFI